MLLDIIVFVSGLLIAGILGIHFSGFGLGSYWQLLDPALLKTDLLHSLLQLHSQPPLFNLFIGFVLKYLPGWTFVFLFRCASFLLLFLLTKILYELKVSNWILIPLIVLFGLHPDFLVYGNYLFYTLPSALLLLLAVYALLRFETTRFRRFAHLFGLALLLCGLLRAVFHPVWILLVAIAAMVSLGREHRTLLLPALILPFVLLNAWYLKNYFLVGQYTGSSWLGMNLARGWVLPQDPRWQGVKNLGFPITMNEAMALYQTGAVSPEFVQGPFQDPSFYKRFGYFTAAGSNDPVLDSPFKSTGQPNFNHRDYARLGAKMKGDTIKVCRIYPGRYAHRVLTSWKLFLQPGPNAMNFVVDYDFSRVVKYRDFLNRMLFAAQPIWMPGGVIRFNLLYLLFPALLLYMIVQIRVSPGARCLFVFVLLTVCWAALAENAIEIGENDRLRWELDAMLLVPAAQALHSLFHRIRSRFRPGA